MWGPGGVAGRSGQGAVGTQGSTGGPPRVIAHNVLALGAVDGGHSGEDIPPVGLSLGVGEVDSCLVVELEVGVHVWGLVLLSPCAPCGCFVGGFRVSTGPGHRAGVGGRFWGGGEVWGHVDWRV